MDKETRFKSIIEENRDRIWRLCCCYVADENERHDVYQDALGNLWRGLDGFEGRSEVSTWIYRVTANTCLGHIRTERRRRELLDADSRVEEMEIVDQNLGEEPASGNDDVRRLYECIGRLRPVDRTLISLYLEELSTKGMSDILGISEANVRVKIHRLKKELKRMFEETGHGLG